MHYWYGTIGGFSVIYIIIVTGIVLVILNAFYKVFDAIADDNVFKAPFKIFITVFLALVLLFLIRLEM